jgi:CDP-diacylglycerol--glycerol-3-phosphate 3-phosphatidyltransferase
MLNLANILTLGRLALLPFIVLLLFIPANWAASAALALYVVGAITDWLDGYIARKYNKVTEFGTFLDPISDKVFVSTIMIMLIATDRIEGVWVVLAILILTREFIVSGLREFLGPKEIKLAVSPVAKWKTTLQMLAIGLLIIGPFIFGGVIIGLLVLTLATITTLYTGWDYLKIGWEHMKEKDE